MSSVPKATHANIRPAQELGTSQPVQPIAGQTRTLASSSICRWSVCISEKWERYRTTINELEPSLGKIY